MSIPLHVLKTDVRRTRVMLLVWFGLVALRLALVGIDARPGDQVMALIFYAISVALPLFTVLVLVALIPQSIHEQPLVGTTAFWFTRPIGRADLLQAKALLLLILVMLPATAEIIVVAANGVTPHDVVLAVPEILMENATPVLAIAVLAALTPGFARFALVGTILFVAVTLTGIAITAGRALLDPTTLVNMARNVGLLKSRSIVTELLVVAGGTAVLAHQFLTRRTTRSAIAAGGVAVAAVLCSSAWPWSFFASDESTAVAAVPIDVAKVKIAVERTFTQDVPSLRGAGLAGKYINAQYDVFGLPSGLFAIAEPAQAHLTGTDGKRISTERTTGYPDFSGQAYVDAIEHALGGTVVNSAFPSFHSFPIVTVDAAAYDRYAGTALKLTAEVGMTVYKYEAVAKMPVIHGGRSDHGSEHVIITDVLHQGDGVEIRLERRRVNLLFSRDGRAANAGFDPQERERTVYVLYNSQRHQIVLPKRSAAFDMSGMLSYAGERLVRNVIRLPFGPEQSVLTPIMDDNWLRESQLVRLDRVAVAKITRPLAIDDFRLNGENAARRAATPARKLADNSPLLRLKLPENASKDRVREYVENIVLDSQGRSRYAPTDPQVEMLAKVGPQNVDVLLDVASRVNAGQAEFYLITAVNRLARPEDKAAILQALPKHRLLIETVVKYDWKVEAHDTLVAALRDEHVTMLPRAWIQAIASFEEPETYSDLTAYLVRGHNRQMTFNAIRKLPGIDLRPAVDAAWDQAKHGSSFEVLDASDMAAVFGHVDAIGALASILKQDADDQSVRRAAIIFRRYTPATGEPEELVAWYETHRTTLTFDASARKFVSHGP